MFKSPPKDSRIEIEKLNGFYRGVVEDNIDPKKAGRVRIRIHGIHSPKKIKTERDGIPTDELPWAEPCMPIHEGSVSGFGSWAVPLQGSHVMVFFENGNITQPRYFASMPAIPKSKESYHNDKRDTVKTDGFKDPDGEYPTKHRLEEPDFHRLARGKSRGTLVDTKNNERDIAVVTALGGNWSEPESPFAARYPHNHVIATHGGITIELDSTPGASRLHLYHPSNSFIEIDDDGNMVIKNNGECYEIVTQGKNIHIKQQRNLTIDEDSKKRVGGNEIIEIGGDRITQIDEDLSLTIGGSEDIDITGNKTEDVGGNLSLTVGGNISIEATGNITLTSGGTVRLEGSNLELIFPT